MTEASRDADEQPREHHRPQVDDQTHDDHQPQRGDQARAEDVMRSIAAGADPAEQAFQLSNEFTDRWTTSFSARVKRLLTRRKN